MITIKSLKNNPESIIEYSLTTEDSPDFCYDRSLGAIFINADESVWLWRTKCVRINVSLFYDYDKYNLFLMSINTSRFDLSFMDKTLNYDIKYVTLFNTGILPRRIKRGDLIGVGYLLPKIESHIVERTKKEIEEE